MKKNRTITMLTVALGTLLSSCVGADIIQRDDSSVNEEGDKVNFTSKEITGELTRLSESSWTKGDQIGITMLDGNGNNTIVDSYTNYCYEASTTSGTAGFTQKSGDMFFPTGVVDLNFRAYHPYTASPTNGNVIINTYTNNQPFLSASTYWRHSYGTTIGFQFKHLLAKITIKLVSGANTPDITFSMGNLSGGYSKGTYSITTGEVGITKDYVSVISNFKSTGNANEYYAYLLPQTLSSTANISVSVSSGDAIVDMSNKVIELKSYVYTITINKLSSGYQSSEITNLTTEDINASTTVY